MSGFHRDGWYELTTTKAEYWHRGRSCGCQGVEQIARVHIEGLWPWELGPGGRFVKIYGIGPTDAALYEAISGRPSLHRQGRART